MRDGWTRLETKEPLTGVCRWTEKGGLPSRPCLPRERDFCEGRLKLAHRVRRILRCGPSAIQRQTAHPAELAALARYLGLAIFMPVPVAV